MSIAHQERDYERPSVAVDAAVFGIESIKSSNKRALDDKKLKLLLIKRGEDPFKGNYSLAGGFLRPNETVEEAAHRELKEEAGVENSRLLTLKTYSEPNRDPRGWIISCAYLSLVQTVTLATDIESDAELAEWFDFEYNTSDNKETIKLTGQTQTITIDVSESKAYSKELAFDHAQIIYDAYMLLKREVKDHDIIFDLLPELFTISDIQIPYETIMGKKEIAANFRKKILRKIEETDQYENTAAHRASKMYRRRKGE